MMDNVIEDNEHISTDKMNSELMFKKVTDPEIGQFATIDLSAGRNLRRLSYLLKSVEDLTSDTFIHNPRKEFLVNVVNKRHSIILQKMRENVETLRLICAMDRNYRARLSKKLRSHSSSIRNSCSPNELALRREHCMEIEGDDEIMEIIPESKSANTLVTPGCDFDEIDVDKCNIDLSGLTDLESIISKAADSLSNNTAKPHSSNFNTVENTMENENDRKLSSVLFELDMIEGTKTPIINDVKLDQAANEIMSLTNLSDNKEFGTIIMSTSDKYTKMGFIDNFYPLSINTKPVVNQQWYVLKPEQ